MRGIAGLLVMWSTLTTLIALAPADIPRINEVTIDWRVLLTASLTTILTGLLVGVLPAMSSATVNPQATCRTPAADPLGAGSDAAPAPHS